MALAKDETRRGHSYYVELLEGGGMYELDEPDKISSGGINMISRSSSLSSPSSTNSNNHLYRAVNEESHSVISFEGGFNNNNFVHADGSLLSFDQDDYSNLELFPSRGITNVGDNDEPFGWLNSEETSASDTIDRGLIAEQPCFYKRPHTGESMQTLKKQCTSANRKPKPKSSTQSSKDPQSIAAKNRRERISERLKILQDLVPNGSKKAISYVKFLQLQVKVLATDELWPVQGGKAPELSQVKDAIDAILASQRDANSSSK